MPRIEPKHAVPRGPQPSTIPPPPPGGPPREPTRAVAGRGGPQSPSPSPPSGTGLRRRAGGWLGGLAGRLRDAAEALGPARGAGRVDEFATFVASARQPAQIESALVALAGELTDACRVELSLDRDEKGNPDPRRVALWPEASASMSPGQIEALGYPLCLGLWCGDQTRMTLQVYPRPGRGGRWPARTVRRLTTFCSMAAVAERGLHGGRRARPDAPVESSAVVRDATFLNAILPYALSQARRHREPLTVFCVEIDHLAALHLSHGADAADSCVRRVAEAIARTLRGSDVVSRLDDDRLVVILPNTGPPHSLTVAGVVRSSVDAACLPAGNLPELSASVGVSCFPDDALDMATILSAADEAMTRARGRGRNQIATFSPPHGRDSD